MPRRAPPPHTNIDGDGTMIVAEGDGANSVALNLNARRNGATTAVQTLTLVVMVK